MTLTAEQQAIENDKENKKKVVIEIITEHCNDSSQFEDLKLIGEALQAGDKLDINILTGGLTNFSYRISLEQRPEIQLYAKLCFARALWNPDPDAHYDLIRTVNEFKMMGTFNSIDPGSVAIPYLCLDVDDMKLLVTQWSPADEQWANQFIDGTVDVRVIPKFASALAKLHCMEFDPDFNIGVRETQLDFFPGMAKSLRDLFDPETDGNNRVSRYAKDLGQNTCVLFYDQLIEDYNNRECLAHNDTHVFNILVEKKPNINTLEQFGPEGKYALCDWEMTISTNFGRDIALFYTFPVSCIVAHAINGNKQSAEKILDLINLFWTEYTSALHEFSQKDSKDLCAIYRSVVGQLGWWNFHVNYVLDIHIEFLPFEGNLTSAAKAKESLGYLGLKWLELAYGKNYANESIESLQSIFQSTMNHEITFLLPSRPSRRNMRSSMLRASGRRVSDASMYCSMTSKVRLDLI